MGDLDRAAETDKIFPRQFEIDRVILGEKDLRGIGRSFCQGVRKLVPIAICDISGG